jgi:hypothetical protein
MAASSRIEHADVDLQYARSAKVELQTGVAFFRVLGVNNGSTSLETPRIANRQKGTKESKSKYKRRSREPWSTQEIKELRSLAKGNTPTGVISLKLQRPPAAIRSKAQREGISLKPANRSPYNRRKRSR